MTRALAIERDGDDVAVVVLRGEHEWLTGEKLQAELPALLDEGRSLVIDLTEATFLDSSTASVLLAARREAGERGLQVFVVMDDETGPSVRRLFDITGLRAMLDVHPSLTGAVAAIRVA